MTSYVNTEITRFVDQDEEHDIREILKDLFKDPRRNEALFLLLFLHPFDPDVSSKSFNRKHLIIFFSGKK